LTGVAHPRFPIIRRRPEPVESAARRLRRWPAATPDRTRPRVAGPWQLSGSRPVWALKMTSETSHQPGSVVDLRGAVNVNT